MTFGLSPKRTMPESMRLPLLSPGINPAPYLLIVSGIAESDKLDDDAAT